MAVYGNDAARNMPFIWLCDAIQIMCTRTQGSETQDHTLAVAQTGLGNRRNKKGTLQVRLREDSAPIVEIDGHGLDGICKAQIEIEIEPGRLNSGYPGKPVFRFASVDVNFDHGALFR